MRPGYLPHKLYELSESWCTCPFNFKQSHCPFSTVAISTFIILKPLQLLLLLSLSPNRWSHLLSQKTFDTNTWKFISPHLQNYLQPLFPSFLLSLGENLSPPGKNKTKNKQTNKKKKTQAPQAKVWFSFLSCVSLTLKQNFCLNV